MNDSNATYPSVLPCRQGYNLTSMKTCEQVAATLKDGRYFTVILTAFTGYLFVALVGHDRCGAGRKRTKPFVNNLMIGSVLVTLLMDVRIVLELFHGNLDDRTCTIIHWTGGGLYSIGTALSYTILWARQRKFYADPLLTAGSVNKVKGILSTVIIAIIYVLTGVNSAVFVSSYVIEANKYGCDVIWDHVAIYQLVLPCALTFCSAIFLFQFILLYLIVHPLLKGDTRHLARRCSVISVLLMRTTIDIHMLIKRLAWCASICVLSSLFMAAMVLIISLDHMQYYWVNFIAFDMLVNNIATVCTFVDWKVRLFPLCTKLEFYSGPNCSSFSAVATSSDDCENKFDSISNV